MSVTVQATVTLPASQYRALIRMSDMIKEHILAEHVESAGNHWQHQCKVCYGVVDDVSSLLLGWGHNDDTLTPCWIRALVLEIERAFPEG